MNQSSASHTAWMASMRVEPVLTPSPPERSSTLKMTTRLSLLLLMAILCIVTLGRAQDATTTRTCAYETGEHLQMSASLLDSGKFTTSYWTGDNISRWKVHLALQLVKHRELND